MGGNVRVGFVGFFLCIACIPGSSAQEESPTPQAIIARSVQANARDWKAQPTFDNFERDQEPGGGTKTFSVMMIAGSPYNRLVKVNGEPLSARQQAQEQQKLDAVIAARRNESKSEREARIAKYEEGRKRDHALMEQLTKAFDFTLQGEATVDGHDVYVLKATPRPGYQPPSMETQVLLGMQGTLWIDKKTSQWVKVEAQVIHPVSIAGFLAKVEPGTRFELEKMPVENDIWLPKHFSMKARAKVLFLFNHNSSDDETYFDYHKAQPVHTSSSGG
ncbi:MAG TPA: hypothetical protein VMB49_14325 [Acidobacteriaceae bacterium]|nr:hypothetical protein [Acidobacteriaceae bacterium]